MTELHADVVESAEKFIRRFCVLPDAAYLPLALWTVATYIPHAFGAFPYIALLSPVKGCGKTRVLEILELLCANPQRITSASPAAIYRMMKDFPTLLLDEVEALRNAKPTESGQIVLAILNAGHRKGATVPRCVPPDWAVEHFPVYGPKVFAAIGRLPDTLADRCIRIPMQRKTASQTTERFLFARTPAEAEPIHAELSKWTASNADSVCQAYNGMGDLSFLADREADLWMPIFALCAVAMPERMDELKRWTLSLCKAKAADDQDDSLGFTLLTDVRNIWPVGNPHMMTASLIESLECLSESPWAEPESKLTPRKLAGLLRPFGIVPRQVRIGAVSSKGYQRADFVSAFSRYLPSAAAKGETSETTRMDIEENSHLSSETSLACFGSENTLRPA